MIKEFTSQTEETMGINVCFLEVPCSATREEIQTAVEKYIDEQNNKRTKERIPRNLFEARQIEFFDEEYRSCREKSFTNYVGNFDDERDAFWSVHDAKSCLLLNMRSDVNACKDLGYYAIRFKDIHNTVFSEEYNNLAKEIDEKKAYFAEQEKQRKIECQHCGSLINASYIKKSRPICPVCHTPMKNMEFLGEEEIKRLESRLSEMRTNEMETNAPLKWLIAIWVKSDRY